MLRGKHQSFECARSRGWRRSACIRWTYRSRDGARRHGRRLAALREPCGIDAEREPACVLVRTYRSAGAQPTMNVIELPSQGSANERSCCTSVHWLKPCADALVAAQPKELLMPSSRYPEIIAFIDLLAETGSHYRMDEMEALYTEDLGFLVLTPQGEVARFSKSEMMAEFRSRRDA